MSSRRLLRALLAVASAGATSMVVPVASAENAELASRFTLGVLPDTQFYSRYATPETGDLFQKRYGSRPYETQTAWLVENSDDLNMPFVTHLGDVVDQPNIPGEWAVADEAMKVLEEAGLNYSILPGNHDLYSDTPESEYSTTFPVSRAQQNETFQERFEKLDAESEYHIFEAEGQKFLVLALGWRAPQEALDWAQSVIDKHPDLPVILTSHEILNIDGDGEVFLSEDYGQHLWDDFISHNDQIFLTIGGHHHGAGHLVMQNDYGHDVINVLQDYQMAYQGGNGLLGLIQFDLTNGKVDMTALSPWVSRKPQETLNQFDHVLLEGADSWSVDMDFAHRFADFAPHFAAGEADDPDYAARAREIVTKGYQEPQIDPGQLPQNDQDYPVVEGTVAHWRPGQVTADGKKLGDGEAVPEGAVIPDVSGNGNDMKRAPLSTRGSVGAQLEDVTASSDKHELSSDTGSLVWANKNENDKGLSWFETAADAAANSETFEDGYTFETFVKISDDFDGDNHWMGAIAREGERGDVVEGIDEGQEPPAVLAVSSLRELQWSAVATSGDTAGTSNWSHEVPKDEWLHVAIVNNPETNTVEMFVNGAPILRDVIDSRGLASADAPWLMGAAMWDGDPTNPWNGAIGETRITHGALPKEKWLSARVHEDAQPQPGVSSHLSSQSSSSLLSSGSSGSSN
ncbi:LamG-like jellyroll fold domain-containing protein [Corynebacterium tapiri]|uniref:Cell wall anchor domain protein n=1 Tax=Corynebacterium tapiri TaxID=1448266 RepID=A0A5C4U280_9CORY|nr:LamG-like jellyroll fold domain-containing protein [Corynebacterium tapiri]TNL96057.1 cell wall anchor domain protein [Corynebacterium tapiri]